MSAPLRAASEERLAGPRLLPGKLPIGTAFTSEQWSAWLAKNSLGSRKRSSIPTGWGIPNSEEEEADESTALIAHRKRRGKFGKDPPPPPPGYFRAIGGKPRSPASSPRLSPLSPKRPNYGALSPPGSLRRDLSASPRRKRRDLRNLGVRKVGALDYLGLQVSFEVDCCCVSANRKVAFSGCGEKYARSYAYVHALPITTFRNDQTHMPAMLSPFCCFAFSLLKLQLLRVETIPILAHTSLPSRKLFLFVTSTIKVPGLVYSSLCCILLSNDMLYPWLMFQPGGAFSRNCRRDITLHRPNSTSTTNPSPDYIDVSYSLIGKTMVGGRVVTGGRRDAVALRAFWIINWLEGRDHQQRRQKKV